jgi:hypothetical protein
MHTPLFIILIYGESYKWIGEGVEKRGVGLSKMGWRGFPRPGDLGVSPKLISNIIY